MNLREIAADYLHLAQDADGNVDRLRNKRYADLLKLADEVDALQRILKKMPKAHRFANPAAFATAFEVWFEEFKLRNRDTGS